MTDSDSMMMAPIAAAPGEIATSAAAANAIATVQARYALAVSRPRNLDHVRLRLLADCKRPGFAEVARYAKPIGGSSVEGPSIRFVEAGLRAYGNVLREVTVAYDTPTQRCVRVVVTDLETNVTHQTDVLVSKTVERRRVRDGQRVLGERVNTRGDRVYIVEATDDEAATKQAALVSKAIRELGLRVLPGDLVDEAQAVCAKTRMAGVTEDPARARKALVDAFFSLGVEPDDLDRYLGHKLAQSTPAEVANLRQLFVSIRDGVTTWREVIDELDDAGTDNAKPEQTDTGKTKRAADKVRAAAAAKQESEAADAT
jgi:hypothetical protein